MNPERIPVVLASVGGHQFLEGDCACPVPSAKQRVDSCSSGQWKIAPSLYRINLHNDHELVFNYLGPESIAILNRPACDILDSFNIPHDLKNLREKLPYSEPNHILRSAKELINLGLLVSPDTLSKKKIAQPDKLTAWLHVTNSCNLACDYCYLDKTPERMDIQRGRQAVDAVFRSASINGFQYVKLKYSGGEATLNFPLVLKLHEYASHLAEKHGLGLEGVVLSNGVSLTPQMISGLKKSNLRLSISLDGTRDTHDTQRRFVDGRGSFSYVEKTLDRLSEAGFVPSITITITSRNLKSLPAVVRYVLERNLPFTLNFYRENDCSSSFADLAYKDEEIIFYMREAFKVIEGNLPAYSLLGSLVDRARLDAPHEQACGVGDSYLVIDQNGGVSKCHMEIEKTITDISVEDPLRIIRADQLGIMNHPVDEKESCRDCEWRYWCAGGCPALTYRVMGSFRVKSPNCRIYKALFPEVLRLEGLRLLKYGKPL